MKKTTYILLAILALFGFSSAAQTTILPGKNGGTGIANTGKTITLGGSVITTGTATPTLAFGPSSYTYTFPIATGTLALMADITNTTWLQNGNTNGSEKWMGTADNYDLPFRTNNSERLRITNMGDVGIGTVSPSSRLNVNGDITIDNGDVKISGLGNGIFFNASGFSKIVSDGSYNFLGTFANYYFKDNNGTNNAALLYSAGTPSLGIGTITPSEVLHITGYPRFSNASAGMGKVLVSDANGVGTWTDFTEFDSLHCWTTLFADTIEACSPLVLSGTSTKLLGPVSTGTWTATKIGLDFGGTNTDLSATGGTSNFLRQNSIGANITVVRPAASDLSNGTTGTGSVVLTGTPTISTPSITGHPTVEGVTSTGATGTGKFVFDASPTLSNPIVGTQAANDNSTKAASTAYVDAKTGDISYWRKEGVTTFNAWYSQAVTATTPTVQALNPNLLHAIPLIITNKCTADSVAMEITIGSATGGSLVRMGIYASDASGLPGTLLVDAGTINATSATVQRLPVNVTLQPGLYWLSFVHNATLNPTFRAIPIAGHNCILGQPRALGAGGCYTTIAVSFSYASLPANFPAFTNTDMFSINEAGFWVHLAN